MSSVNFQRLRILENLPGNSDYGFCRVFRNKKLRWWCSFFRHVTLFRNNDYQSPKSLWQFFCFLSIISVQKSIFLEIHFNDDLCFYRKWPFKNDLWRMTFKEQMSENEQMSEKLPRLYKKLKLFSVFRNRNQNEPKCFYL